MQKLKPLSWIRVDLVGGQIDLDMVQMDLIEEDQVVLVRDYVNPTLRGKPR